MTHNFFWVLEKHFCKHVVLVFLSHHSQMICSCLPLPYHSHRVLSCLPLPSWSNGPFLSSSAIIVIGSFPVFLCHHIVIGSVPVFLCRHSQRIKNLFMPFSPILATLPFPFFQCKCSHSQRIFSSHPLQSVTGIALNFSIIPYRSWLIIAPLSPHPSFVSCKLI